MPRQSHDPVLDSMLKEFAGFAEREREVLVRLALVAKDLALEPPNALEREAIWARVREHLSSLSTVQTPPQGGTKPARRGSESG